MILKLFNFKNNFKDIKDNNSDAEKELHQIVKHGNIRYKTTITIGYTTKGKAIRKSFIGKTNEEALAKLNEYRHLIEKNPIINENDMSLAQWLDYYLNNHKAVNCKPSTYEKDAAIFRNYILINKKLSQKKLRDLNVLDFKKHYDQLVYEGKLSSTIKNNNKAVIAALNVAMDYGYLNINPAKPIAFSPTITKEKYQYLSTNDRNKFLSALNNTLVDFLLKFALLTGMRISEILALTWDDIDFDRREISVTKSLDRLKKETLKKNKPDDYVIVSPQSDINNPKILTLLVLGPTKNRKNRIVPISSEIIDKLYNLYINRKFKLIFCNKDGFYLDEKKASRRLNKILTTNLIPIVTLHDLRHTFSSMLFDSAIDIKTVAELIGDSYEVTEKIYIHVTNKRKSEAIDKLDQSMFSSR